MPWDRRPGAKKASPRRDSSSPRVCWHLQRPFRRWRFPHLACQNRLRPPLQRHLLQQLATMRPALPPRRALMQKPTTSCLTSYSSLCRTLARRQAFNAGGVELVLSPSTIHADSSGVASDSPGVRGVLGALLWGFPNSKTGCCFRSYEAIAAKARCFRDTVYEAHKVLKNARVLTWGSYIPAV
jgi:hypothetical protein